MEDPYKVLGAPRDATQEAIRIAYRRLAKQHHPDLNPGNAKAEERFKTVSAANALLSDPEKRGRFDRGEIDASGQEQAPSTSYRDHAEAEPGRRYATSGQQSNRWRDDDLSDIFGAAFHGSRERGGQTPVRGQNEVYSLSISFLDAVNGVTRRLTRPDGRILEIAIPAGTDDRQVLRLRGQGAAGYNEGPPGDALIELHVAAHRYFRREGQDILLDLPVTLPEAILGGYIEVPTPRGPLQMRIPPRSDTGTELRLRGRGLPAHDDLAAGDLYAKLSVVVGTPDEALEEFLRTWKPEASSNPRKTMEKAP